MEKIHATLKGYNNKRFIRLLTGNPNIATDKEIIIVQEKKPKPDEKHKNTVGEDRLNDLQMEIKDKLFSLKIENGNTIIARVSFDKIGLTIMAHDPITLDIANLLWDELKQWMHIEIKVTE